MLASASHSRPPRWPAVAQRGPWLRRRARRVSQSLGAYLPQVRYGIGEVCDAFELSVQRFNHQFL